MLLKLFDFSNGLGDFTPERKYAHDVGADVRSRGYHVIYPGKTIKIPLGFGIKVPTGCAGYIFPRGSTALQGLLVHPNPIDPGYTGEVHAVITNCSETEVRIDSGERIAQLIVSPCVLGTFTYDNNKKRKSSSFGSTGID